MNISEQLKLNLKNSNIYENEDMKKHTTFKIGGKADYYIKVRSIEDLRWIVNFTKENNIPLTVTGNGSNLLVKDNGIRGITVNIDFDQIDVNYENNEVLINLGAGVKLGMLARKLADMEIQGFEFASGIPGTIGGAVAMNAGAYGKEFKDIVSDITTMDYNGNIQIFTNEQANFSYRHSKFLNENYIILKVKLLLKKGNKEQIKQKMQECINNRKEKQPIEYPSAGSTFKRGTDFITAKLIDDVGLKGYSIGGAQISEKHAGFIINNRNATAEDVLNLVEYTKNKVYEKFKKNIELEIKVLGEK